MVLDFARLLALLSVWMFAFSSAACYAQSVADDNLIAAGYYSRQQWPESIDAFSRLIENHPGSVEASVAPFYLGEAYMQTDQFQLAYRSFQQYLVQHPRSDLSARATFRMGEAAYQLENDQTAIRLIETFARENPEHPLLEYGFTYLGEMRLRRVEPQLAQRCFELSLQTWPQGKLAHRSIYGLAQAYHLQGALQEAIDAFQIAADDPEHPLTADADLQIAHIFLGEDEHEAAQQHLRRAIERAKNEETKCEATLWLSRIDAAAGDTESAYEMIQSIVGISNSPQVASTVYFEGASLAAKLGHWESAHQWLTELLDQYPQSKVAEEALHLKIEVCRLSNVPAHQNEMESVIGQYLSQWPQGRLRPSVLEKAGRYYYFKQEYSKASGVFSALLDDGLHVDPAQKKSDRNHWLYLNGLALIGETKFAEAEVKLLQIDITTASDELQSLYHLALGTTRFGLTRYGEAIPGYSQYLASSQADSTADESANRFRARNELTICYGESGFWTEAMDSFQKLQQSHRDQSVVTETAAWLTAKAIESGQTATAIVLLERLVIDCHDEEKLPRYLSNLAWLKFELGETGQANELFRRLLEEYPQHELTGSAAMAVAKSLEDTKQYERAAETYDHVIQHFGVTDFGRLARLRCGHALQKMGDQENLEKAASLLSEYLSLEGELPARDEALYQLGWIHFELGDKNKGHDAFERLIAEHGHSKYHADAALRLAYDAVSNENYSRATSLVQPLTDNPEVPEVIRTRGIYLLGEVAAKQDCWSDVTELMSRLTDGVADASIVIKARYWLAEAAYRQHRYDESARRFAELKEQYSSLGAELHPWIWLRQAQSLGQLDDWSGARAVAEQGKEQFDSFLASFEFDFLKGRGLEQMGLLTDARECYQQVVDSKHGRNSETAAIAQWRIGETYFHQENYAEAIKAYFLVDSNYAYKTWRSAALLQAGKCQEHLGNHDHAKKLFTRLMEQFPDSAHGEAATERLARMERSETHSQPPIIPVKGRTMLKE